MERMLVGVYNLLDLIENNWTLIVAILGLSLSIYKKVKEYLQLSTDEKIDLALASVKESMIVLCTEAELMWDDYKKSGSVKRSQVIDTIFEKYSILLKSTDKDHLIKYLDNLIDEALIEVRKVVNNIDNSTI